GGMGAKCLNLNNDGGPDLSITAMHSDMWVTPDKNRPEMVQERKKYNYVTGANAKDDMLAEKDLADMLQIRYEEVVFGNTFFKNEGNGEFREISDRAGLETWWPWGIATGDFDNDGYEDVFIPSGMGYPYFYWRNYS